MIIGKGTNCTPICSSDITLLITNPVRVVTNNTNAIFLMSIVIIYQDFDHLSSKKCNFRFHIVKNPYKSLFFLHLGSDSHIRIPTHRVNTRAGMPMHIVRQSIFIDPLLDSD